MSSEINELCRQLTLGFPTALGCALLAVESGREVARYVRSAADQPKLQEASALALGLAASAALPALESVLRKAQAFEPARGLARSVWNFRLATEIGDVWLHAPQTRPRHALVLLTAAPPKVAVWPEMENGIVIATMLLDSLEARKP